MGLMHSLCNGSACRNGEAIHVISEKPLGAHSHPSFTHFGVTLMGSL